MEIKEQETDSSVNGERVTFYLQLDLSPELNKALVDYAGIYKSRSHFINCAISRELRRIEKWWGTNEKENKKN